MFKYQTSWGREFFEVFGSKERYYVSVELPALVSTYCACPAFALSVLLSNNRSIVSLWFRVLHICRIISLIGQCKHVLAVQIARRLGKCVERTVAPDELVALVCQYAELDAGEPDQATAR